MLIKCVMSPLICLILLTDFYMTVYKIIISLLLLCCSFQTLFLLKVEVELIFSINIHLFVEIFQKTLLLNFGLA